MRIVDDEEERVKILIKVVKEGLPANNYALCKKLFDER